MVTITYSIVDADATKIGEAFEKVYGLAEGETRLQLVRRKMAEYAKEVYKKSHQEELIKVSVAQAATDADALNIT